MSRYIDLLVAREKKARSEYPDSLLPKIVAWHREQLDKLNDQIASISTENKKALNLRRAHHMHKMTIEYLKRCGKECERYT